MNDMNSRGMRRHHNFDHHHGDRHDSDQRAQAFGPRGRHEGFGPDFGPGPRRGPRGGRPRGDVRGAVLVLLAEQPRHGYDLMRGIEERSGGVWSPSPGSIYPTLQALEDEGLVTFETVDGRKTASVTDAGREWLGAHEVETENLFATNSRTDAAMSVRKELMGLRDAASHVARHGDADLAAKVVEVLASSRRELYSLLASEG